MTAAKRRRVKGLSPLRGLGQRPKRGFRGKTSDVPPLTVFVTSGLF